METEIKFRGMPYEEDKWLYGDLIRNEQGTFAIVPPFEMNTHNECNLYEVDEDTICQFTGWLDMKNKEIYEHDIVRDVDGVLYEIWYENGFCLMNVKDKSIKKIDMFSSGYFEVLGSIFDFKV